MDLARLRECASVHVEESKKKITLVVSDIEGCLNLDERTYDFRSLEWIRTVNELARADNALPFVTVCSGRQHAFVEAIIRFLAGRLPALFENGCGLFFPDRRLYDEYQWHPALGGADAASHFSKVRETLALLCEHTGARRVIGKEVLLSLHPSPPMTASELSLHVADQLHKSGLAAEVGHSASAVDVAPQGITKGTGLEWLLSVLGASHHFALSKTVGIGDSNGDLPFLRLVRFPAAPANATSDVRDLAVYCSAMQDGRGVVDIIEHYVNTNLG